MQQQTSSTRRDPPNLETPLNTSKHYVRSDRQAQQFQAEMAASIKIEFDDGSKVMERVLGDVDPATPLGFVKGIDIDLAAVGPSAVEKATPRTDGEIDDVYENNDVARYINHHD